ncbi:hypothetical protein KI387_027537, partial [Taxus chinensis]
MDWKDRRVEYAGHKITVNEELIVEATSLEMEGLCFFSKRVDKKVEEKKFVAEDEVLMFVIVGLWVSSIPPPFDEITCMMVRYISLEE